LSNRALVISGLGVGVEATVVKYDSDMRMKQTRIEKSKSKI